jgi:hypothetical protein
MSKSVHSVKLIPYDSVDLDRLSYSNGDIVYDVTTGTLRLMDGVTQGGTKVATQPYVTSALAAYATTSALTTAINTEVSNRNSAITTALSSYATTASLSSYDTIAARNTALSSYATTASLSSYVTNSSLTTTLSSYATTASLSSYVTSSNLTTTLNSYATTSSVALKANTASPTFTGTITAPKAIIGGYDIKIWAITMGAALS